MLILTRKPGESVYIGDNVKITIVEIKGHQIRVGIEAPRELRIYREEIYEQILEENRQAAASVASGEVNDVDLDSISAAWGKKGTASGKLTGFKINQSKGDSSSSDSGGSDKPNKGPEVIKRRKKKS